MAGLDAAHDSYHMQQMSHSPKRKDLVRGTYLHKSAMRLPLRVLKNTTGSESPYEIQWYEPQGELSSGGWYGSLDRAMKAAEELNPGVEWNDIE